MTIDLTELETRLELIAWRDRAMDAVTNQLESAFPALMATLPPRVEAMTKLQLARSHADPRALAQEMLRDWTEEQGRIAFDRARTELDSLIAGLKAEGHMAAVTAALPAMAGVGMLAASIVAIPALVTYATVTTTTFLVFTTSAVSVPILLAGGTALAALSFSGSKMLAAADTKARAGLVARVEKLCRDIVFGTGLAPDARCLLNDLQAAILKASQNQLAETA